MHNRCLVVMTSRVAHYLAAYAVISAYNTIFPVTGQCTLQMYENGGDWNNIATELSVEAFRNLRQQIQSMRELLVESVQQFKSLNASIVQMKNQQDTIATSTCIKVIERRSQKQEQDMMSHNVSFQQIKNQQGNVVTSLQAIDRRSRKQEQDMKNLNASLNQVKNQQDTLATSLQAVDRRPQQEDVCIKHVQSIHDVLNATFLEKQSEHAGAIGRLDVILLLLYHDASIKNRTQNSWRLVVEGDPVQLEIASDFVEGLNLLPSVHLWTILMHRYDGSLNFNRNWTEYKNGFGDIGRGEFWIGNEKMHRMTNRNVYTLRIEVQLSATGRWYYADYDTFSIDSEINKYTLRLSGFSGNAGDSLTSSSLSNIAYLDGMSFSTFDADNDNSEGSGNCASNHNGGWWFNSCQMACFTCTYNSYFRWYSLNKVSPDGKLRAARMMMKLK